MLTYAEEYIKKKTNYLVGVLLIKCFKKKKTVYHSATAYRTPLSWTGDPIRNSGIFLF